MEEVQRRTSRAPLAGRKPLFMLVLIGLETKGLLDFQGRRGITSAVRWSASARSYSGSKRSKDWTPVRDSLHLSGPVLRDTARLSQRYPPIARYGVLGVSTWPIGCDTPSPFSQRFPLGEHAKWRCDTPPPKKGYLSDTCAIPYENKANGCDTPLCDTISTGYCAIWGGISHWAAKVFTSARGLWRAGP